MIRLAAIDSRVVTALVVGGMLAVFGVLLVITSAGELRGRRKAKVPASMRPAPSDEELEASVLPRYLAWGFLATAMMAVWLPIYWIREPTRLTEKRAQFAELAVTGKEGGEKLYDDFCLSCHGKDGAGVDNEITVDGVDTIYAEPPLRYVYSRYNAAGLSEDQITQLIYDAVIRGRANTPMPTWGAAFGGPFNSHQVDNVVAYIQSIQETFPEASLAGGGAAIFADNCMVCHGVGGTGRNEEGNLTIGPNLTVALDRLTIEQLRETIQHGRLNTNRPSMPSWAALGEDAIDALVRFIQSIQRSA